MKEALLIGLFTLIIGGRSNVREEQVTATIYHAVEGQPASTPLITASGKHINPDNPAGHRWIQRPGVFRVCVWMQSLSYRGRAHGWSIYSRRQDEQKVDKENRLSRKRKHARRSMEKCNNKFTCHTINSLFVDKASRNA